MAALTLNTTSAGVANNGTQSVSAVAVLGDDGSNFLPAMDAATRPGYVRLCDGTDDVTLVNNELLPVAPQAATLGGATPYSRIATGDTNAANIKASAGTLYAVTVHSATAAVRYVKLYDKSTAPSESDTPVMRIATPATAGLSVSIPLPACGVAFANGIGIRIVTEQADSGTTGATAGDVVVNLIYK